jgi:hypothetical protein
MTADMGWLKTMSERRLVAAVLQLITRTQSVGTWQYDGTPPSSLVKVIAVHV